MTLNIPRQTYADLYGPTVGDRVRLADTELIIEVEQETDAAGEVLILVGETGDAGGGSGDRIAALKLARVGADMSVATTEDDVETAAEVDLILEEDAEQVVAGPYDPIQAGFRQPEIGEERGGVGAFQLVDLQLDPAA